MRGTSPATGQLDSHFLRSGEPSYQTMDRVRAYLQHLRSNPLDFKSHSSPELESSHVLFLDNQRLYPYVICRRQLTSSIASVDRPGGFDKQHFAFLGGEWFVLSPLGNDKHFS